MKQSRSSGPIWLACLAMAVVALGIGYRWVNSPRSVPPAPKSTPDRRAGKTRANEDAEPREVPLSQYRSNSLRSPIAPPVGRPASAAPSTVAPTEPTPQMRQLVASLTNLDLSHGPITREQAQQWKQGLQGLIQQGASAVPAIREFLQQNQELNFAAVNGGNLLGQSSLRTAFIDALQQIGGPEAAAVMLETMQTTAVP